jgi:formylmethanofuran dehydrogenase subunit D
MKCIMNTGRTINQGCNVKSKTEPGYQLETSICFINPLDMLELGIEHGDSVILRTDSASVVMICRVDANLPPGTIFVPFGPYANFILNSNTHGTGMPDFKSCIVEIFPTTEPVPSIADLFRLYGGTWYE